MCSVQARAIWILLCVFVRLSVLEGLPGRPGTTGRCPGAQGNVREQLVTDFQAAFGEHLESNPRDDLLELARSVSSTAAKPKLYCTCGREDSLRGDNLRFRDEIAKLDFDVVYEE